MFLYRVFFFCGLSTNEQVHENLVQIKSSSITAFAAYIQNYGCRLRLGLRQHVDLTIKSPITTAADDKLWRHLS